MSRTDSGLPTPTDVSSSGIGAVRRDLQRVVESLIELGVIVHDYAGDEPRSSELLQRKLSEYVEDARHLAESSDEVADVSVPLDILTYIDHGRNPDIYSREFVELVMRENQAVSGEVAALHEFGSKLGADLKEAFPSLTNEVDRLTKPE